MITEEMMKEFNVRLYQCSTINNYAELIEDINTANGWDFGYECTPEKLMLMVTEISEAMEEYRKGGDFPLVWYSEGRKPEGLPVELIDVIIRIFHYLSKFNIDVERVLSEKIAYNITRPYRHGDKIA